MLELGFTEELLAYFSGILGGAILSLVLATIMMIVCLSYLRIDILYSAAISGIPFVIYIINLGNKFYWLLGGVVLVYGVIAYVALKNILGQR